MTDTNPPAPPSNPFTGYYCVIQYCSDLGRRETINIGVLLLVPAVGYMGAKIGVGLAIDKANYVFGGDETRLALLFQGYQERVKRECRDGNIHDLETLKHFVANHCNAIQLVEPRPMKVIGEPDAELERLFKYLVE